MTRQEGAGWGIVAIMLLILLWLLKQMGTGTQTAVVQSGIALPGGQTNAPTTTVYGGCASC